MVEDNESLLARGILASYGIRDISLTRRAASKLMLYYPILYWELL